MSVTEERVNLVEEQLRQTAYQQMKTELSLQRLSSEMKDFKDEMADFKDEMTDFKDEMTDFKCELRDFVEESKKARIEQNKRWGDLANKLGTLVEDIVAPSFRGVARDYFGVNAFSSYGRDMEVANKKRAGVSREFDLVAATDSMLFVIEAKSNPRSQYAMEFVQTLPALAEYFPDSGEKTIVPIFSSLNISDSVQRYLTENGVYCMVMGEENMTISNFHDVQKKLGRE